MPQAPIADFGERVRNALEGTRKILEIARGLRTFARTDDPSIEPGDIVMVRITEAKPYDLHGEVVPSAVAAR